MYFSLPEAQAQGLGDIDRLPMSLKILLENLLRFDDGVSVIDWQRPPRGDGHALERGGAGFAHSLYPLQRGGIGIQHTGQ